MTTKPTTRAESFTPIVFQYCDPSCVLGFPSIFWVGFSSFYVILGRSSGILPIHFFSASDGQVHSHYLCSGLMAQAAIRAAWVISPQPCLVTLADMVITCVGPCKTPFSPKVLSPLTFPAVAAYPSSSGIKESFSLRPWRIYICKDWFRRKYEQIITQSKHNYPWS